MIQYNLTKHLERRGIANANQLSAFAGLTIPTAYAVLSGARLERIQCSTLERLAAAFGVKPWALLEWTPDEP